MPRAAFIDPHAREVSKIDIMPERQDVMRFLHARAIEIQPLSDIDHMLSSKPSDLAASLMRFIRAGGIGHQSRDRSNRD
jgi:hypothetical protein